MPPHPDRLYCVLRLRREKGWLGVLSARALRVDDALLEHYNWRKGRAYPGYETLRRDTGLSRDSVSEALRELEFYGRWVIYRTPRRPNVYCLPPELVPDVPAARYVPSARWTRRERLAGLRTVGSPAARQSRASHRMQSRASRPIWSRALDKNHAVTTQLNNAVELRHGNGDFHSPPKDKPSKGGHDDQIAALLESHRRLWEREGRAPEMFAGLCRSLAVKLRCSEDEAGALLTASPPETYQ